MEGRCSLWEPIFLNTYKYGFDFFSLYILIASGKRI